MPKQRTTIILNKLSLKNQTNRHFIRFLTYYISQISIDIVKYKNSIENKYLT